MVAASIVGSETTIAAPGSAEQQGAATHGAVAGLASGKEFVQDLLAQLAEPSEKEESTEERERRQKEQRARDLLEEKLFENMLQQDIDAAVASEETTASSTSTTAQIAVPKTGVSAGSAKTAGSAKPSAPGAAQGSKTTGAGKELSTGEIVAKMAAMEDDNLGAKVTTVIGTRNFQLPAAQRVLNFKTPIYTPFEPRETSAPQCYPGAHAYPNATARHALRPPIFRCPKPRCPPKLPPPSGSRRKTLDPPRVSGAETRRPRLGCSTRPSLTVFTGDAGITNDFESGSSRATTRLQAPTSAALLIR